jgi:hypothetical protein
MIISTHALNPRCRSYMDPEHIVVDVRHVGEKLSRPRRQEAKRLQDWLDGIRFDRTRVQLLELAARAGAGR